MTQVFTCPVCGATHGNKGIAFSPYALAQHIRDTHERTATLKCPQCGRIRARASGKLFTEATLKQHEDAHLREYNRLEAKEQLETEMLEDFTTTAIEEGWI